MFSDMYIEFGKPSDTQTQESDYTKQAKALLVRADELITNGYPIVGVTYSANAQQVRKARSAYLQGKPTFPINGANQALVCAEIMRLLDTTAWQHLLGKIHILCIETMSPPETRMQCATRDLSNIACYLGAGAAVLGWQNQNANHSTIGQPYALGGGVSGNGPESWVQSDAGKLVFETLTTFKNHLPDDRDQVNQTTGKPIILSKIPDDLSNAYKIGALTHNPLASAATIRTNTLSDYDQRNNSAEYTATIHTKKTTLTTALHFFTGWYTAQAIKEDVKKHKLRLFIAVLVGIGCSAALGWVLSLFISLKIGITVSAVSALWSAGAARAIIKSVFASKTINNDGPGYKKEPSASETHSLLSTQRTRVQPHQPDNFEETQTSLSLSSTPQPGARQE